MDLGNSLSTSTPAWGSSPDTMPFRRILHDAVQLPNGLVLVINGAQVTTAIQLIVC